LDLAPYIRELILLNECVILPDFGGFETHYAAAEYDVVHKRMLPPTKKVQFRADYIKGGEVLENHLCKHLNIKKEQASVLIRSYVQELNAQLDENREIIIAGVGLFTKGLGNSIDFSPFENENYLAESFGLDALPFEKSIEKPERQTKELKIRPRSNTLLFVVVGIGLICLLLILTIFISSKFDLYLFNIGDNAENNEMIIIGNSHYSDSIQKKIDESLSESTNLKSALYYSEQASSIKEAAAYPSFFLVAGSFRGLRNAELTRKELIKEGYSPEIIENDGYFRVTIGSFSDKMEAINELQRLRRQLNRSVWLLSLENNG
jgi:hypothetical protein